jgi:hypothetical protein
VQLKPCREVGWFSNRGQQEELEMQHGCCVQSLAKELNLGLQGYKGTPHCLKSHTTTTITTSSNKAARVASRL